MVKSSLVLAPMPHYKARVLTPEIVRPIVKVVTHGGQPFDPGKGGTGNKRKRCWQ